MTFDTSQRPYRELRSVIAEKTNKLVVWIGSGLSAAAGLPTWPELKNHLIEELRAKADRTAPGRCSRTERGSGLCSSGAKLLDGVRSTPTASRKHDLPLGSSCRA